MPKAKPKVPKTEKMWMGWGRKFGFHPRFCDSTKKDLLQIQCNALQVDEPMDPVLVRIMPEAEYQRLIAASKRKEKEA
jgi:hypothetical protein